MAIETRNPGEGKLKYYPTGEDNPQNYNTFIKLTSYKFDDSIFSNTSALFGGATISVQKEITNQIFLPIPTSGLNITDTLNIESVNGGANFGQNLAASFMNFLQQGVLSDKAANTIKNDFAPNEFMVSLFRGIQLRKFNFVWNFIPSSDQDSKTLMDILKSIRKSSLPSYAQSDWTIAFPNFWVVEPYVASNRLYELNYLMCDSVNINFDGQSQGTSFFYDGKPVNTTLTISFVELYPSGNELITDNSII